ncbi:hypothetical protein RU639_006143 [Aspergillus parasiticus]
MNIGDNARQAAGTLGYQFKSDTRLIEALTTPGVEGEGSQGNRWLGDFGIDVIRSCLSFYAYESKIRPNQFASTKQKLCSYNHLISCALGLWEKLSDYVENIGVHRFFRSRKKWCRSRTTGISSR